MKILYIIPLLMLALSCTSHPRSEENTGSSKFQKTTRGPVFTTDTLYKGFKNPWGMTWLPDGRMLVTERAGEILIFNKDKFTGQKLEGVPTVYKQGQGGLFDIQLHPKYKENGWIYIAYAKPGPEGGSTAIMRFKLKGNALTDQQEIFRTTPLTKSGAHFGGRIIFDKKGYLYFSSGERGTKPNSQDLGNDLGKIHRIYDDGRIPQDNPFVGKAGARPSIWSYGHRNPQGMVYDSKNDIIWAHEHGAKGGDELNLIEKGANYGWPLTTYGVNYDGSVISEFKEKEGITKPVHYWVPSIAPCGMVLVTSDRYKGWKGNLLIGALAKTHVARIQLKGKEFAGEEKLLENVGRVRCVAQSPDGYIYVLTEGSGLMLKLEPIR
ncbi:MAG TPA: PQQ-dependent sugar dehydrogenase [Sphingobacteriaceae bacterium]